MYKLLIRPFLFLFDPEKVHGFTFMILKILHKIPGFSGLIRAIYTVENLKIGRASCWERV